MARSKKQGKTNKGEGMAAIPWGVIVSVLPSLVDSAAHLFSRADAPPKSLPEVPTHNGQEQLDAVIKRLDYFETLESSQAKLLQQTIEQLQNVTLSAAATARRTNIALATSVVGLVVGVVAVLLSVFR
jgi:hypothetical protein